MFYGPNRYVCTVLDEMRKQLAALKWGNVSRYKAITALMIEEAQTMVNRMEAGLEDVGDLERLKEECRKEKKKLRKLQAKVKALKEVTDDKEDDSSSSKVLDI